MQKFGCVFPGQGSQKLGMLSGLADQFPAIIKTFNEASEVVGHDLWDIAQHDTDNNLDQTHITQPVLLSASVAVWRLWTGLGAPNPAIMAGHSLGEYSALVCAGVLDFQDGVNLVRHRGECMQNAVSPGEGAMAAIVGLEEYKIREICESVSEGQVVAPANLNSPGQTVIAGNTEAVNRAIESSKEAGAKRAIALKVSVPSHCALMQDAADQLAELLNSVTFSPASIPVVQNFNAQINTDGELIKENLVQQLTMPVLWMDTVNLIEAAGIKLIVECGAGKVLCGLIKRINSEITCLGTEDSQSFLAAKDEVSV